MKLTFALCLALACAVAPALAVPVSVTVVGPDNKPLPGAKLSIVEGKIPVEAKAVPRDIAGENGRFQFDWDGAFPAKDATMTDEPRTIYVRAQSPGMTMQTRLLSGAQTTIHLQIGRTWSGTVRDETDKPVAGVPVEIKSWSAPESNGKTPAQITFAPLIDAWKLRAITDANGRWQIDDLLPNARVNLALDDARFAKKLFALNLGALDAPPLFVRPGATLTGVLLTPDEKPIVAARVYLGWSEDGNATRTDAQGRFTLTGVAAGEVSLRVSPASRLDGDNTPANYLVPTLNRVSAVAGETTDVGAWKAVAGLELKANVVDEATQKPISGANLNFWFGGNALTSDAQGQIRGRVLPAALQQGMGTVGSVSARGYASASLVAPVVGKESATLDLGTIALTRGATLAGNVRVEGEDEKTSGNLPPLRLRRGADSESIYLQHGKSDFTTQALKPGNYSVSVENNGPGENKDWQVVSPRQITVLPPAATAAGGEAKMAPVEIVLKRLTPAIPLLGTLRGAVADAAGQPLGGAVVRATLRAGNINTDIEILTQIDGSFEIERTAPNAPDYFAADGVEIKSIERPGYLWASQPRIETRDGATTIGNLKMRKRGAIFDGRVVGANGQGAAGAWVGVLEARDFPPVQADAEGKFEMADLPLEKFTLIGADNADFGRAQTTSDAENFVLQLTPNAPADREALAARALEGPLVWWNASPYWDILGTERMAQLLARGSRDDMRAYEVSEFVNQLARRDPADLLRRAPALLELAGDQSGALEAKIFALRAASNDADDRIAANAWLDEQKAIKREINAESVTRLLQMAVVAHKLGRADAASWLDYAAAVAAQLKVGVERQSQGWGAALAQIGTPSMAPFVEEMNPIIEFNFWQGASVALAKGGDVAAAKAALARMEELGGTPALIEQGKKQPWDSPAQQIAMTRQGIAMTVAATGADLKNALELLPTGGNDWQRSDALLVIADRAITAKDAATAENALRQIVGASAFSAEKFALAASLAQELDPKLGAQLWPLALKGTLPDKNRRSSPDSYRPSAAMWAFYHARLDAGQSRVLIEREWNWRVPLAVKTKDDQYSGNGYVLNQLELAMAAVDPARAFEMRDEARAQLAKPDAPTSANEGLAAALLATPQQRARFGVNAPFLG